MRWAMAPESMPSLGTAGRYQKENPPQNGVVPPIVGVLQPQNGVESAGGLNLNPVLEALFDNRTATCTPLFLHCYGEGHAQRIARTFGFGLNMTQRQLRRLEEQGVLVSHRLGNLRLFSFNDRNPTVRNLRPFLDTELESLPRPVQQQFFRQRQRPRQSGKALASHG